jgi:hypothetical protein
MGAKSGVTPVDRAKGALLRAIDRYHVDLLQSDVTSRREQPQYEAVLRALSAFGRAVLSHSAR